MCHTACSFAIAFVCLEHCHQTVLITENNILSCSSTEHACTKHSICILAYTDNCGAFSVFFEPPHPHLILFPLDYLHHWTEGDERRPAGVISCLSILESPSERFAGSSPKVPETGSRNSFLCPQPRNVHYLPGPNIKFSARSGILCSSLPLSHIPVEGQEGFGKNKMKK